MRNSYGFVEVLLISAIVMILSFACGHGCATFPYELRMVLVDAGTR